MRDLPGVLVRSFRKLEALSRLHAEAHEIHRRTPLAAKSSLPAAMQCPRCATTLHLAHDLQGNMPFTYWRCATDDGHFIAFLEFLKKRISSTV